MLIFCKNTKISVIRTLLSCKDKKGFSYDSASVFTIVWDICVVNKADAF